VREAPGQGRETNRRKGNGGMKGEKHKVPYRHFFLSTSSHAYTLSQKNNTDVAHYNFNAHQPILVIFGRDVAESMLSNGDLLSHLS